MRAAVELLREFKRIIFPGKCISCGELINKRQSCFCPNCENELNNEISEKCGGCGKSYSECNCRPEYLKEYRLISVMPYGEGTDVCRKIILFCKYRNRFQPFEFMAERIERVLRDNGLYRGIYIAYVPRSPIKAAKYDHDQALVLAAHVSKRLSLPLMHILGCKTTEHDQKALRADLRLSHARTRFFIKNSEMGMAAGKRFILIDDVVTSGATMRRCAELLYLDGAKEVICVSAARSVRYGNSDNTLDIDKIYHRV